MIYHQPKYQLLGDCLVAVSFADTVSLAENFRIHAIADAVAANPFKGLVEVVPHIRTLGVVFDRSETTADLIIEELAEVVGATPRPTTLRSRLFEVPVWYDDPWSAALALKYGVPDHLDFLASVNGIPRDEVVARHTGTDFWISAVGFVPGCYWALPLDMSKALSAPKYTVPRDFTPARAMALAGLASTIYPYAGPGGYQCIGRTPIEFYQLGSSSALYPADGALVRRGDRHRYRAIDALEYDAIREQVRAGTYQMKVSEEDVDLNNFSNIGEGAA